MGYNRCMDPRILAYLPLVSPIATLIVVFVGILFSNRHVDTRVSDLQRYMDARFNAVDQRFAAIDQRFADMEKVADARTQLILGKIEDVDTRLTRLEERFAR